MRSMTIKWVVSISRAAPENVNEQQMFAQQGQHVRPSLYTIYTLSTDILLLIVYYIIWARASDF